MKICSKCKAEKPAIEFGKNKSKKDGACTECKSCAIAYQVKYRSDNAESIRLSRADRYLKNCDIIKAAVAAYQLKNPEKIKARNSAYYAANTPSLLARAAKYRSENKDKINSYFSLHAAENPDLYIAKSRNRRARKRNADGSHSASDVFAIFENQRGLCANCRAKLFKSGKQKYHVDHIMPLALGGSNWPDNLQCLCQSCNLRKSAKHPLDWAKQQGKLL